MILTKKKQRDANTNFLGYVRTYYLSSSTLIDHSEIKGEDAAESTSVMLSTVLDLLLIHQMHLVFTECE